MEIGPRTQEWSTEGEDGTVVKSHERVINGKNFVFTHVTKDGVSHTIVTELQTFHDRKHNISLGSNR